MRNTLTYMTLLFLALSCASPTSEKNRKLHIVTTTGMLYDAVISIVGEKMTVESIMGPGVDPHLYKATQGDLQKLNKANLIVYNGIKLEGRMENVLEKLGRQKLVVAATKNIPDHMLLGIAKYDNAYDPHIWFDVLRWKYAVKEVSSAIIQLDTAHQHFYQENTIKYLAQLDTLDAFVRRRINEIPPSQRILVTAHDAFRYFGETYDIRVEALQGMSTVANFGLKDIANLIDIIIQNNIKALFIETSISTKSINAVLIGCREKGHQIKMGGYLYSDAMGELGTREGTYIGMFKHNVNTIVDALK